MTGDIQASQDSAATTAVSRNAMRFTVDGWDPAYGTSLELEDYPGRVHRRRGRQRRTASRPMAGN